jgi:signal transduction histidine kinase
MSLPLGTYLLLLLLAFGVAMCVWVYQADPVRPENRGFPLMVLAILAWVSFYHLAQFGHATRWLRVSACFVFLFFVTYYFFVVRWFLAKRGRAYNAVGVAVLLYGVTLAGLAAGTGFVIRTSAPVWSGAGPVIPGVRPVFSESGWWTFYGFVLIVTLFINGILVKEYLRYTKERRLRVQYFLIGLLLFAVLNIVFNVVLPVGFGVYEYYQIGNYSVVFLLGFTAYAIVRQEMFGIRTVLTVIFVSAIGLLLAIDMLAFTENRTLQLFKGAVLILFGYFGYMLVRSVQREIGQREELQRIAAELQRSDDAKTEFMSIVSHQLRTPLNAIAGYLSLLLEGMYGNLDAQKREPVERLYRSNQRLIHLVKDLLGVSRIQMGRIEMEMEEVDLCRLITGVVKELTPAAEDKGIELSATCPEAGVPAFSGDTNKLRDSVLNLVDNAIRYTSEGGVSVSLQREGDDVLVRVRDTGPGVHEDEMNALFESFQRGVVGRREWAEGTGLGLYIAQQFVAMHGGKIWAESAGQDKGSTFYIRLPLRRNKRAA